jgi:hypothetical protein
LIGTVENQNLWSRFIVIYRRAAIAWQIK